MPSIHGFVLIKFQKSNSNLQKLNTYLIKLQSKLKSCKKDHKFFEKNHVCPTCTQQLSDEFRENKLEESQSEIDKMDTGIDDLESAIVDEQNNRRLILTEASLE